jgi:hypothetical protein
VQGPGQEIVKASAYTEVAERPNRKHMNSSCFLRGLAVSIAAASVLIQAASPARAYPIIGPLPGQHLIGSVASIQGSPSSPSGLILQLGLQTAIVKVVPQTVIVARSTEADVEGLLTGEYALVTAQFQRKTHAYVARRVTYDVQAFFPLKSSTGTIMRQTPDGKRFLVRLPTSHTAWYRTSLKLTRYEEDGRVIDAQPQMVRGEGVVILSFHTGNGWIAVDVSLTTTTHGSGV